MMMMMMISQLKAVEAWYDLTINHPQSINLILVAFE